MITKKYNILYLAFYKNDMINLPLEYNIKTEYINNNDKINKIKFNNYDLVILGSGMEGKLPTASKLHKSIPDLYNKLLKDSNIKILGICYGMQLLSHYYYNHDVVKLNNRNKLIMNINLDQRYSIVKNIPNMKVQFNHKYYCPYITSGIISSIKFNNIVIPSMIKYTNNHYGVQFHFLNKYDLGKIIKNIIIF